LPDRVWTGVGTGPVNHAPSRSAIDVIVHTGDAEWWQIVAALGPLVVLLVAAIGWFAQRRPIVADAVAFDAETIPASQSAWWSRARWALEASLDDDPAKREVGLAALELLNTSSISGKEETLIIAEAWRGPLRDRTATRVLADKNSFDEGNRQDRTHPEERVIVRAARLRLSTDKKQGIESPSWVKEIAKLPLDPKVSP
jgi:hypothetical protein